MTGHVRTPAKRPAPTKTRWYRRTPPDRQAFRGAVMPQDASRPQATKDPNDHSPPQGPPDRGARARLRALRPGAGTQLRLRAGRDLGREDDLRRSGAFRAGRAHGALLRRRPGGHDRRRAREPAALSSQLAEPPGRMLERQRDRPGSLPERSEEHTSELQSLMRISYAVFCLKKKKQNNI